MNVNYFEKECLPHATEPMKKTTIAFASFSIFSLCLRCTPAAKKSDILTAFIAPQAGPKAQQAVA